MNKFTVGNKTNRQTPYILLVIIMKVIRILAVWEKRKMYNKQRSKKSSRKNKKKKKMLNLIE